MISSKPLVELQKALQEGTATSMQVQQSVPLLTTEQLAQLLSGLQQHFAENQQAAAQFQQRALEQLVPLVEARLLGHPPGEQQELHIAIGSYYLQLPADDEGRGWLLRLLAALAGEKELTSLAELMAADPPVSSQACALALSPLFRRKQFDPAPLFPRLLDALAHQAAAPAVLDLANYLTRQALLPKHPAAERTSHLADLLGEVAGRLMSIEQRGQVPDATLQQQVREGVALAVALCDALAQIGDRSAIGKLRQALGITHRRIHTEAAYALAKLGEEEGRELLTALAAEPAARLRVLAYAEELGVAEDIDPQHRTAQALAEAELTVWLAEPLQMGMPPHRMELVDHRQQYWPGFDDPVDCYLFRFSYEFPGGELSNIGIAGPLTMAFRSDLGNLPADSIYAAFAGWQAEHADVYETPFDSLGGANQRLAERYANRLTAAEFSAVEPLSLGHFFEQRVLIAQAEREGVAGVALVDEEQIDWWPAGGNPRALGPREVYSIWKGKRLLETFNA